MVLSFITIIPKGGIGKEQLKRKILNHKERK
jgi:hypothetical protein